MFSAHSTLVTFRGWTQASQTGDEKLRRRKGWEEGVPSNIHF